jgi:signal transduction histidine kinase/CheY-like chemotaxis protein
MPDPVPFGRRLEVYRQRLETLASVARTLAAAGDELEPAARSVVHHVADLTRASCVMTMLAEDGRSLRPVAWHDDAGELPDAPSTHPLDGPSLEAEVIGSGQLHASQRHGLVVVPMLGGRRVVGTLSLRRGSGPGFSEDELSFLQTLADTAAAALDAIRLREDLRREAEALQRSEAELARANRLKDEFLATVSHELRTPLNAVLGWIHLLRVSPDDPVLFERAVETIERNGLAQARIISDLLDVSNIVAGQLRMDPEPIEVPTIVYGVVESLRGTAEAKRIQLDLELDPAAGLVHGDGARLRQVAWCLVANALKFTPRHGQVTVRVEPAGSHLLLAVEDNGEGISAEFLGHVFDGFRQEDASPSRRQGGLGMGLALARHLVELHGGTIGVRSAGPGQGAVFEVRLPRLVAAAEGETEVAVPGEGVRLEGVRILVVDDDTNVLEIIGTVLRQRGAIVEVAPTAQAALAAVRERLPHAVVADIGLPDESGYALIRRIRALPPAEGGLLPALALTAYARSEDRIRALLAGYHMHIPKPVNPVEVGVAVARLVRSQRGA